MDGWMVEVEVEEHSIPGLDLLIISYYFIPYIANNIGGLLTLL